MPRPRGSTTALSGTALGINERSQVIEAIGSNHSRRNQFPQSCFYFSFQLVGSANDIRKERRSALTQKIQNLPRAVA